MVILGVSDFILSQFCRKKVAKMSQLYSILIVKGKRARCGFKRAVY